MERLFRNCAHSTLYSQFFGCVVVHNNRRPLVSLLLLFRLNRRHTYLTCVTGFVIAFVFCLLFYLLSKCVFCWVIRTLIETEIFAFVTLLPSHPQPKPIKHRFIYSILLTTSNFPSVIGRFRVVSAKFVHTYEQNRYVVCNSSLHQLFLSRLFVRSSGQSTFFCHFIQLLISAQTSVKYFFYPSSTVVYETESASSIWFAASFYQSTCIWTGLATTKHQINCKCLVLTMIMAILES